MDITELFFSYAVMESITIIENPFGSYDRVSLTSAVERIGGDYLSIWGDPVIERGRNRSAFWMEKDGAVFL